MNDETSLEEFAWADLHVLASKLLEIDDESALRGAVSRDYYAVFNCAKEILELLNPGLLPQRGLDSHKAIWDGFRSLDRKQAKTLARIGESLLAKRKQADYQLRLSGSWRERALQAHTEAARGLRQIDELVKVSSSRQG